MSTIVSLMTAEWRYWRQSALALIALSALLLTSAVSAYAAWAHLQHEAEERATHQRDADAALRAQPDRHPHRMVHYGHYVYRTPPPLAAVDPGIDPFTGTSLFLEGHRQNTAAFVAASETGLLARFGMLAPAFALEALAPLLLIFVGFNTLSRERAQGTLLLLLSQGVAPASLLGGKAAALGSVALLALLPLALTVSAKVLSGADQALPGLVMTLAYGSYLGLWIACIVAVSAWTRSARSALLVLLALWTTTVVLVPRLGADLATLLAAPPSHTETTLAVKRDLRAAGDGHNIADPAFRDFRAGILAQYGAERIEDLPVNFRGLVAVEGEAKGTEVLNRYAAEHARLETMQAQIAAGVGLVAPSVALRHASMALAGTDLAGHQRFLEEAEAYRYAYIQQLNQLQAELLSFTDDLQRSSSLDAEQRTRISAEYWRNQPSFEFTVAPAAERLRRALPLLAVLAIWLGVGLWLLRLSTGRLARILQ